MMMLETLTPVRAARLLMLAARNVGTLRQSGDGKYPWYLEQYRLLDLSAKETALHRAADTHAQKLSVAFRYAFATGRRAVSKTPNVERIVSAVRQALEDVLSATLLKALVAGGEAGLSLLPKMRVAEFDENQPRDEQGQWTSGGGAERVESLYSGSNVRVSPTYGEWIPQQLGNESEASIDKRWEDYSPRQPFDKSVAVLKDVDISKIDFSPERIYKGMLQEKLKERDTESDGNAFEHNGRFYLLDGNHRVFAESLKGNTSVRLKVIQAERTAGKRWSQAKQRFLGRFDAIGERLRTAKDKPTTSLKIRFDAKNPHAVKWAKKHAAELVKDITETTEKRIRAAVVRHQETGEDAYDDILKAVGDETRAQLIARHESLLAAHEGQRQGWDQAVENGLLTGDEKRVWIVTDDDKLCPECEELDGKKADLDGEYPGGYDGPPAHVACRCTEGISG